MPDLVSLDFFTVPTVTYQVLFVLVILAHEWRRVVHFNVTAHPTAEWTAQQVVDAFLWDETSRSLLRDRDRIYGAFFRRRTLNMGLEDDSSLESLAESLRRTPHWEHPHPRPVQRLGVGKVIAVPEVGGLYHHYERRAACCIMMLVLLKMTLPWTTVEIVQTCYNGIPSCG